MSEFHCFSAQVERDLFDTLKQDARDAEFIQKTISDLRGAIHFSLPDGGKVFGDQLRGIVGQEFRLPFPSITLSYIPSCTETGTDVTRILLLADEHDRDGEIFIATRVFAYFNSSGYWAPLPLAVIVTPSDCWSYVGAKVTVCHEFSAAFPQRLSDAVRAFDNDIDPLYNTTAAWAFPVFEFCEALTCANVHHSVVNPVDPAVNRKRLAKGKLPLYEVRTLWVDTPGASVVSGGTSIEHGDRRGPRQHLRRGHIRRLQNDNKRVWVNSCVVGSAVTGVIEKRYGMHAC